MLEINVASLKITKPLVLVSAPGRKIHLPLSECFEVGYQRSLLTPREISQYLLNTFFS